MNQSVLNSAPGLKQFLSPPDIDSDFCPSGGEEEEEVEFVSGASDSDFDASPPPKKAKTVKGNRTATKAAGKREMAGDKGRVGGRGRGGGKRSKTEQKRKNTPSATTNTASPLTTPPHPSPLTTTPSPKPSVTSRHGAPVLGMRKKPNWTPPGELVCPMCCVRDHWLVSPT